MKKSSNHSKAFVRGFFCVSIILLVLGLLPIMNTKSATSSHDIEASISLTPHNPIAITSDSGFEVFPGSGTAEDPYVIEGYNITTDSTGISIADTTEHFIIRNCYVETKYFGIFINSVADGTATVINNTCNNSDWGIMLESSNISTVANNTCNYNNFGIYLLASSSLNVINNTCNNNRMEGILLGDSGSSTVANNTFTNCSLYIGEITVDAYLSHSVENNWVNGKKIGFYTNLDSTIIDEPVYGQLMLVNCTNVTVRDQILNYATTGLYLYSCTHSVIINNTCNNIDKSIWLYYSDYSTVVNNTSSNNGVGIKLYSSGSSTVANNIYNDNTFEGIYLSNSNSSTVANNTCNNNGFSGILLSYSGNSDVINNKCNNNNGYGINLWNSAHCDVTYNLLQENEDYGIYLSSSSDDNTIHHNTFVDNNLGGTSQAYDAGANNYWCDTETSEGNYWSDWSGTSNYSIDGSSGSVDLYPLDEPVEYSTDETQLFFTFTLLIAVVPLILMKLFSRRRRKIG